MLDELRDLRLPAGRRRTLLTRRDRREMRLDTLEIREHGVVDAVGTTVLSLKRADVLVALRSRRMVEFERARLEQVVRFRASDLRRQCIGIVASDVEPLVFALRDMCKSPSG